MPCETTGFSLKPDNFFSGNPAIDLPPDINAASQLAASTTSNAAAAAAATCCGSK